MRKILLIEDDGTMSSLIKLLLEIEGYLVIDPSGMDVDFIQIACREMPDLILMDVNLGDQNGLDIIKKLREKAELKKTRVIMTSGMNLHLECLTAGADNYVQKPFMPDDLLNMIQASFVS